VEEKVEEKVQEKVPLNLMGFFGLKITSIIIVIGKGQGAGYGIY
jgi:acetyl-CoA carboxylase alpha subunit